MKLIQQLERKLSWRSSQRSQRSSHQPTTPGLAEGKQRKEKSSKKRAQKQLKQAAAKNAAAVRVSDSEFSAYISFGSGLKTVPLNTAADSATSSYQVVAIRTRAPFQSVGQPPPLLYSSPNHRHHSQSPSPRSEGHRQESDQGERAEHIYDRIDISRHHRPAPTNQHRRSCSLSPTVYQNSNPNWSPCSEGATPFSPVGSQSPTTSWGSNESGGSSSSQCGPIRRRRNRIKTNPWLAGSPWATKALQEKENQPQENIYESIENLLSGSRRKTAPNPINQSYTPPFAQPPTTTPHYYPTTNQATYLKRAARPTTLAVQQRKQKHLITEIYPTSPYHLSCNSQKLSRPAEASPDDLHLLTSPSVEFLNQSQQLCRQISSYFDRPSSPANETSTSSRPSLDLKSNTLERRESTDSMETIDLSPVNLKSQSAQLSEWSLAEENIELNDHYQTKTVSSPAPTPPSPAFRSKRKLASPNMSRPESIYANSRKQSAKVDRLKCQLKEVVHAAIQQAKKKKV